MTIKAIIIGNSIVQQKDINWSKRILGRDALTQMKTNIKKHVFKPSIRLNMTPFNIMFKDNSKLINSLIYDIFK